MSKTPEQLEEQRKKRKEQYLDRKLRQVCCDCEAPLQEGDGVRCVRCDGRDKAAKAIRQLTPSGKRVARRAQKRRRKKYRKLGLCWQCMRNPMECGELCRECRAAATAASRRWRARKAAGVIPIAAERERRRKEELQRLRGKTPLGHEDPGPRARILRALVRFDWIAAADLFDGLGVPEYDDADHAERDRYTKALSRLVLEEKLVDQRKLSSKIAGYGHAMWEYKINANGRSEALERKRAS